MKATLQQRREEWARDQAKTHASMRDTTWNGKQHTCCGSKKGARHKVTCKNALCNYVDDLSDLK
jgi:hypothetical protein